MWDSCRSFTWVSCWAVTRGPCDPRGLPSCLKCRPGARPGQAAAGWVPRPWVRVPCSGSQRCPRVCSSLRGPGALRESPRGCEEGSKRAVPRCRLPVPSLLPLGELGGTLGKSRLLGNGLSCLAGSDVILDSVVARNILPAMVAAWSQPRREQNVPKKMGGSRASRAS